MPTTSRFDVVVCGTGPAGLIAALCAARAGLSTAIVGPVINLADRRTTALLAPSLDVLAGLNLSDAVRSIGTPLVTMRLIDGSRRLLRAPTVSFEAQEIGRAFFGLNCPNADLNKALLAAVKAQGQITQIEGLVVHYAAAQEAITLTLSDGQVIGAQSVLAADGKDSAAREAVGIGVRRWRYPQTAAVGIVRHARPHASISTEFHTETGPFTFVPMPDADGAHRSSFVCALAPDDALRLCAMALDEASLFLEKRSAHLLGALALEDPVQLWPLEALVAGSFAAQGVFLTGESAHAFPPIGAQGLNLSIRDGSDAVDIIAAALKAGENPRTRRVAARYGNKRRADVWARTFGVDALNRSLLSGNPIIQVARTAAMSAAGWSPVLKKGLMMAGLQPFGLAAMAEALRDHFGRAA